MICPIRMLNTNVIKVGGKDSVENVGFLNIRGYMTTVWTLKYWNRGLFFSKYFEEFPVCFGVGSICVPKELHFSYSDFLGNTIPCNPILGKFVSATCPFEGFEQSVSSPDCFKE